MSWARTNGPNAARLVQRLMEDKPHPEMGYRACLGAVRLASKYSNERVESAATRPLLTGACRYKSIVSILKNSLDLQPLESPPAGMPPAHDNTARVTRNRY